MAVLLLLAGVAGVLVGILLFAYALFNPDVRHLDGLLTTAAVALVGGIGLAGLSPVVAGVRRIVDALETQPLPRFAETAVSRAPELKSVEMTPSPAVSETPRAPAVEPPAPAPRPEPVLDIAPGAPAGSPVVPAPATPAFAEWPSLGAADRPAQGGPADAPEPAPAEATPDSEAVPPPPAAAGAPLAAESEPPGPRVLKSGVIEGMPYTLFSDGSVDAELPEGLMHFASIAEWRAHLRETA